jgi:type IV secretory pathway TraG/TraD family ATPase VirD4
MGREDHSAPLMNWRTRANITMALLVAGAILTWHLAVFLTADGIGVTDVARTLRALLHGHPLAGLTGADPASQAVTLSVYAGLLVVLFGAFVAWAFAWGSWRAKRRRGKGLADDGQIRAGIGVERARAAAAQSRSGLTDAQRKNAPITQIGLQLGASTTGEPVVLPLEDHAIIVALTGAGKSRDLMIPASSDAPGALVVTCTRADILDVVATGRARMGKVWVFDPLDRLGWPEPMAWDPVAGCRDGKIAVSRGLAFAAGLGADGGDSTNSGFFRANASSALTRLLHAAALDDRTIAAVIDWTMHLDNGAEEPQDIIRTSTSEQAEPMWASLLRSVATGADDTVSSSRQTLMQAIEPLALRQVLAWVTPREGVPTFDPAAFVASTDTLFLVADENSSSNVAPLCAMLLQEVVDAAKTAAAGLPGGRLDPPLRLVGDEIANVAPLPKLPYMGTDCRGFGMQLILALQGFSQARLRWGADGAATLFDSMPAEIVLGGLTDVDALNRYATLVGDVELTRPTTSYDSATGQATSTSEQPDVRKAMRADEIRQIADRHGLLLYRNRPAVYLAMTPWYERPGGKALEAERAQTERRRIAPAPVSVPK